MNQGRQLAREQGQVGAPYPRPRLRVTPGLATVFGPAQASNTQAPLAQELACMTGTLRLLQPSTAAAISPEPGTQRLACSVLLGNAQQFVETGQAFKYQALTVLKQTG